MFKNVISKQNFISFLNLRCINNIHNGFRQFFHLFSLNFRYVQETHTHTYSGYLLMYGSRLPAVIIIFDNSHSLNITFSLQIVVCNNTYNNILRGNNIIALWNTWILSAACVHEKHILITVSSLRKLKCISPTQFKP